MNNTVLYTNIKTPKIDAYTFPSGPAGRDGTNGRGIREIKLIKNELMILFDDATTQQIQLPDWWFGTRAEYNALTKAEKDRYVLHFIEEGT